MDGLLNICLPTSNTGLEVGVRKKYIVKLSVEEKEQLRGLQSSGKERARKLTWARILLKADDGCTDRTIIRFEQADSRTNTPSIRRIRV